MKPHNCEEEKKGKGKGKDLMRKKNAHLLDAVDEPLLHGRDPFFLLHALLYAGDLSCVHVC